MSLRDELGVRPDPDFDLDLPRGWARHAVDDETLPVMLADLKQRCMQLHQPQLFGQLKAHLEQSFADMRRAEVFAYFAPTSPDEGTVAIPASINASIRTAEAGGTLDDVVRSLIQESGATPLLGDPRTLRFETEKSTRVDTTTIISHTVVYLTPIPGTMRRRALMLVAGFARTPDTAPDAAPIQAMRDLFDACVSTLRWRAPAGLAGGS